MNIIILLFTDSCFIYTVVPVIQNGPQDLSVPEGSIAYFSCLADSSVVPPPSVTWSKDGAVLDISDGTKYMVNTRSGRLFISNVVAADGGVYSCQLENIAGSFTSNPGGRLTVNSVTGTPCVSACASIFNSVLCCSYIYLIIVHNHVGYQVLCMDIRTYVHIYM